MKLFINTAMLCTIPKVVNAIEAKLKEWGTPNTPTDAELNTASREEMENLIAQQAPKKEIIFPDFDLLDDQDEAQKQLDIEPSVITPTSDKKGVAWGGNSTIIARENASRFIDAANAELTPAHVIKKRKTRDTTPFHVGHYDLVQLIWEKLQEINDENPQWKRYEQYGVNYLALVFNKMTGMNKSSAFIGNFVARAGTKCRRERDDCLAGPEDYLSQPEVIRSVSTLKDLGKLKIITKEET